VTITPGSFDRVIIECSCSSQEAYAPGHVVVYDSSIMKWWDDDTAGTQGQELPFPDGGGGYDLTNSEIMTVIAAVQSGAAEVYYVDGRTPIAYDDLPEQFSTIHFAHPFHPSDGWKMFSRMATHGDLTETTSRRHFTFRGGVVPGRTAPTDANIDQSLEDWYAFRNGPTLGLRLLIPEAEDLREADLTTYAPTKAMRDFLESIRAPESTTPLPPSIADAWPTTPVLYFDLPIGPGNTVFRARIPITIYSRTSTGALTGVWVVLTIDADAVVDIDLVNGLLQRTVVSIPAAGVELENLWGDQNTRGYVRDLVFRGGRISMPNGMPLAHFRDPASALERTLPAASGYGRTTEWDQLPDYTTGIKRIPYPEEMPFVNTIHADLTADAELRLDFEDRVVGFAGVDRRIELHNRSDSGGGSVIIRNAPAPAEMLRLLPGEACSIIVSLSVLGTREWRIVDAPLRYLVRGGAYFNLTTDPYDWDTGGVDFEFRPWFPDATRTLRRNVDEFVFGSESAHSANDELADGLSFSPHVAEIEHDGDFIFYQVTELEVRGNGVLKNGHASVLVRQRGSDVSVIGRTWQPDLTGVGFHRTYTTTFVDECQEGDRYVAGLLYPTSGTTVAFSNLRINTISQIMRVAPRIAV